MNTSFILILIIFFIIIFFLNYNNTKSNSTVNSQNEVTEQTNINKQNNMTNNIYKKNNKIEDILNKLEQENFNKSNVSNKLLHNEIYKKINPEILNKLGIVSSDVENFLLSSTPASDDIVESFIIQKKNKIQTTNINKIPKQISFPNIKPNKLYYGLPCDYIKNDSFYDALKLNNFKITDDILTACLIVPCSYETTEKEIIDLDKNNILKNQYKNGVRIFMLNNTDHMVSKLALWKYLKQKYGTEIASTMLPYTWDLTDPKDIELFKSEYDSNKIYITKNNYQRQEGIEIQTNLDQIISSKNKYLLVQELLQDPYLISGRKINLRVYVLVIRDSFSNIKLCIYKDGFMYYTPELFEKNSKSFKKNITTGYVDRQIYIDNPLTHNDFRKWLDDSNREFTPIEKYIIQTYPNIKMSDYIFSQIYQQLGFIFKTYENIVGTKTCGVSFQLYGVDVAINNNLNPLVMEINKGPDLSAKDTRDKNLKIKLCTDILKSVGLLENKNNDFITVQEKVNINGNLIFINNLMEQ